ncbi:MAG: AraC family transcriptional regulator [Clostridia bacterium]|nr:AraC family transcriptional regulator [Clostridia bacterium]
MAKNIIIPDENLNSLNPVRFGYEACKKSHSYGPAMRTHWLIHFVVSGFGFFRIEDREYHVSPGEMFVIPSFVEAYYEADSENPWSYIWIGFTTPDKPPIALDDVICCPEALNIFNAMKTCEVMNTGINAFLSARLWDLFYLLISKSAPQPNYVERALDYIHSEYTKDITVDQIAHFLNISRVYLSTIFKEKMGISPKQYLLNYRMNIATIMMSNHPTSISIIANSVGYSDIYNFSKMFKRHYGVSPKKYIEQHKKNN